ncbi:MAG: hypothetical protein PUC47_11195 [Oscillospiraceae bacterium]|nr:hypothetical protein [Oscillospiraceae bacterium]
MLTAADQAPIAVTSSQLRFCYQYSICRPACQDAGQKQLTSAGYAERKGGALKGEDEDAVVRGNEEEAAGTGIRDGEYTQRKSEELRGNVRASLLANLGRFPRSGRTGFQAKETREEFVNRYYDHRNKTAKRLHMLKGKESGIS